MAVWYKENKKENTPVISSRIRLALNVKGLPFPRRMNETQKTDFLESIKNILDGALVSDNLKLKYFNIADIPEKELFAMVERHTVSPDFVEKKGARGIVISEDETVSVMLLEEDHIRIQVIYGGLELYKAYEVATSIESLLAEKLTLAFDSSLGFLTSCPTNLGTGLRASVMLHLPVLESVDGLSEISSSVSKIGLTVRGMYGEKSESKAALYQLSNQVTLGISEQAAIENLISITNQIIKREENALSKLDKTALEDLVFRAVGTLRYARRISSEETMKLLSYVRLGDFAGILNLKDKSLPIALLIETKASFLQKSHGEMSAGERDILRANIIREAFKEL